VRTLVAQGKGIGLTLVGRLPADALPADVVHVVPDATKATLPLCLLTPRPERLDPVVAAVIENLHRVLDAHFHAEPAPG
jgi:DNA-binding transcriptional LysR family regulator